VLVWQAFLLLYKSFGFTVIPTTKSTSHAFVGNLTATSPGHQIRDILLDAKVFKVMYTNHRRIKKYSSKARPRAKFCEENILAIYHDDKVMSSLFFDLGSFMHVNPMLSCSKFPNSKLIVSDILFRMLFSKCRKNMYIID